MKRRSFFGALAAFCMSPLVKRTKPVTIVLRGGFYAEVLSIDYADVRLIKSKQCRLTDVCRWYNIPQEKLI